MKIISRPWLLLVVLAIGMTAQGTIGHAQSSDLYRLDLGDKLLSDVRTALPERSAVNESFLAEDYSPNLTFSEDAQLAVTFIDEGAGYRNTLGYFEYDSGAFDGLTFSDIDTSGNGNISFNEINSVDGVEANVLFSNFSRSGAGGSLVYGDTLVVGGGSLDVSADGLEMDGGKVFEAGSNVGFFVSANAYAGSWGDTDYVKGINAGGDPNNYYSLDFLNPEAGASAVFGDTNANSRHTAMMFADTDKDSVLVGFEDLRRPGGDNDFNDAIFLVQSNPIEALQENNLEIATAPGPNMGGGLVTGVMGMLMGGGFWRRRRKLSDAY